MPTLPQLSINRLNLYSIQWQEGGWLSMLQVSAISMIKS